MVAGYGDGTLRVFRLARTALELKMRPHRAALTAVAFSTDGESRGGRPLGAGPGAGGLWPDVASSHLQVRPSSPEMSSGLWP